MKKEFRVMFCFRFQVSGLPNLKKITQPVLKPIGLSILKDCYIYINRFSNAFRAEPLK